MSSLQKVNQLINTGQFFDARNLCIKLCNKRKNDLQARLMLGILHGNLEEYHQAESCFQQVIKKMPDNIQAHYNLGYISQKQGKYKEAVRAYKSAIRLDPVLFQARYNLGEALRENGELDEAENIFTELLQKNQMLDLVHSGLASILYARGKYDEALIHSDKAISYQPSFAMNHVQRGRILYALGNSEEALSENMRALDLDPALVDAYMDLGDIYHSTKNLLEAAKHYENAIHYGCKKVNIFLRLGDIHILKAEPLPALQYYNKSVEIDPSNALGYAGIGQSYESQGIPDKSIEYYEKSLALNSDLEQAIAGLARQLAAKGGYARALELLTPVLEKGTSNPEPVCIYANICVHFEDTAKAISALTRFLENYPEKAEAPYQPHYQLGMIYDTLKEYDRAFHHFEHANKRSNRFHDVEKQFAFVDSMISAFSNQSIKTLPRTGITSELPVFIVGMPRSGTTLVEQILDSHSLIHGAGELSDISRIFTLLMKSKADPECLLPDNMHLINEEELTNYASEYLEKLTSLSNNVLRVTNKLPHNFVFLGFIEMMFPQARIIHCCRNPVDTCLSIYFHDMDASHPYANDLHDLGHSYCKYLEIMQHWKQTLDLPILDVHYESMVNDQQRVARDIVQFCGLDWDSQCLSFHKNERTVSTHSANQVRKPIYTTSMERWRNYEKHIPVLLRALECKSAQQ